MPTTQNLSLSAIGAGVVASTSFTAGAISVVNLGNETQRAVAALPQSAPGSLFTVTGKVQILSIVGEVVTGIQAQANNTKLQAKATGQTAVDMCAVLDITGKATTTLFGITGVAATALQSGFGIVGQTTPWVVQAGTIDLNCAASNTGTVKWTCRWVPIDTGSTLVAA